MNPKISFPIAIIIIVALAVLVGGIAVWQYLGMPEIKFPEKTQLKDETADWKTYRNEEYGFEFKYPKNLICKESTPTMIDCAESNNYTEWEQYMKECEEAGCEIDDPYIITLKIISAEEFEKEKIDRSRFSMYELYTESLLQFFADKDYFNYYEEDTRIFVGWPCQKSFGASNNLGLHWFIHFVNKNPNLYIHYCATALRAKGEGYSDLDTQYEATGYDIIARQMLSTLKFIDNTQIRQNETADCIDSDGLDFYTKGTVSSNKETYTDKCTNDILEEYFCVGKIRYDEEYRCPNGCEYGHCVYPKPTITILSPNKGEKWEYGKTYIIEWESKGVNKINIGLQNWEGIIAGDDYKFCGIAEDVSASTGKYSWTIKDCPISIGDRFIVRITDVRGLEQGYSQQAEDQSDGYFSIK